MKTVLSIAGSDSGGGAGIQQDLKTFTRFKVHGTTAITAVTAQNSQGVRKVTELPVDMIESQIDSIMQDIQPAAVKTGMLSNPRIIALVIQKAEEYNINNLIVDPVMVSTSGDSLFDSKGIRALKELMQHATLSTPNIPEAEIITGIQIHSMQERKNACEAIGDCVLKGGHIDATDILYYQGNFEYYKSEHRKSYALHGTGCAFSAAIAANLALGSDVNQSVREAKRFMDIIIEKNFSPGQGMRFVDTGDIRYGKNYESPVKNTLIETIGDLVSGLLATPGFEKLIPEVGLNLAMALEGAKTKNDVCGVSGRIVKADGVPVRVGNIRFGGTSHVARIILTAMKHDPEKRAAMNIGFSEEKLKACRKLGLRISSFNRENQPKDTPTMEWGTDHAIGRSSEFPDIIYDLGGFGKEAMLRIIADDAQQVAEIAKQMIDELKDRN